MKTLHDIQQEFRKIRSWAREDVGKRGKSLATLWSDLFGLELSKQSQECFESYHRNMVRRITRRNTKTRSRRGNHKGNHKGGMAPLDYTMTPGSTVNVYGRFPTEIATDPQSIQDLDVFYRSALSRGCGVENSGRVVPQDMGSNKVGGGIRSRRYKGGAETAPNALDKMISSIQDMGSTLGNRPYLSTTPVNPIQSVGATWSGSTEPVPVPSSPVEQVWAYKTNQSAMAMDPSKFVTALPPTPQFSSWRQRGGRRSTYKKRRSLKRSRRT